VGDVGDVVGAIAQEDLDGAVVEKRATLGAGEVGPLLGHGDEPQADVASALDPAR
jgi:hypothetical protein